jgi:hypothetical protein
MSKRETVMIRNSVRYFILKYLGLGVRFVLGWFDFMNLVVRCKLIIGLRVKFIVDFGYFLLIDEWVRSVV